MIRVPAGSFAMGSPEFEEGHRTWEPHREVSFGSDFYLGKTPVTQDQYENVIGTNPTVHEKIGDAPVDSVTWDQASAYCQKRTQLDRAARVLLDDWEYRLPPWNGEPQEVAWFQRNGDGRPFAELLRELGIHD